MKMVMTDKKKPCPRINNAPLLVPSSSVDVGYSVSSKYVGSPLGALVGVWEVVVLGTGTPVVVEFSRLPHASGRAVQHSSSVANMNWALDASSVM
eukprot:CAMPEP_0201623346 /NCGR_PEP_ID=MMETSP0492-20130828/47882_1 /ASSEMBLY_ACC=CAM_ASM_000837 /TAXON_ID=420259 /ORGANISM="Thalassiosira gravida, Strain GMp14c1" /LENGTH=94 /DNA_ID=CAMNT_0048092979 /DNA_START=530 /DNA_END=814 /DNA_ORIENTATION=-